MIITSLLLCSFIIDFTKLFFYINKHIFLVRC